MQKSLWSMLVHAFLVHGTGKSKGKCSTRFFCLVITSSALVSSLFACPGYEKHNLLPVVWHQPIYLSLGSAVTSQSRLTPRLGFVTADHPRLRWTDLGQTQVTDSINHSILFEIHIPIKQQNGIYSNAMLLKFGGVYEYLVTCIS